MKRLAISLAIATLAVGSARAEVLSNGLNPISGTTFAAEPQLGGVVLEDQVTPFSFAAYGGLVSGSVQSRVVRSNLDGTLDFYWRVSSDAGSAGPIGNLRLVDFATAVYKANYRTDGVGEVAPDGVFKFSGADLNFLFGAVGGSAIGAGATSYFLLLDTDATSYARTALYDLTNMDSSAISNLYPTFAPAVPEPATYALLAAGLLVVTVARRRSS